MAWARMWSRARLDERWPAHPGADSCPAAQRLARLLRGLEVLALALLLALLIEAAPASAHAPPSTGEALLTAGTPPVAVLVANPGTAAGAPPLRGSSTPAPPPRPSPPSPPAQAVDAAPAEVPGGPLLRLAGADGAPRPAVLLETRLQLRVAGLLARATLLQRFRNDSDHWREAEYLLPLPADAAVQQLQLQVGERRIVGEIREREAAREVYAAARRAGQRSALLEQQRPNLFTTRVANIPPRSVVQVRVDLLLPVRYRDGRFSLRFPTTLTPRYVPGAPLRTAAAEDGDSAGAGWLDLDGSGWAPATDAVPDAPLISALQWPLPGSDARPHNPLRLDVELDAGTALAEVGALYHDLSTEREADRYRLVLRDGVAEMDRDLVLQWRARAGAAPRAALFHERFDGEDFALLMLLPPQGAAAPARLPRELLLVLDVSGSMQGEPIRQARASVAHALAALGPEDYVNLILFNDGLRAVFPMALPATDARRRELRHLVEGVEAGGGTEMQPALLRALRSTPPESPATAPAPLRQVLFVTDGAVGNEDALLQLIEAERREARLYTVGIGSAPNGYFMRRAAELGRGEALFIARPQEVAPQLDALFRRIARPMSRDLEVEWPQSVEAFPARVPDLYAGQPLLQAVRFDGALQPGTLRVSGRLAGRDWTQTLAIDAVPQAAGVAAHWARRKQAALLGGLRRGEPRDSVRAAVLPLALRFSLASPFTSFVAREVERARPVGSALRPASIANTRPAGQAPQRFAFPQTATSAAVKLYLGLFLAFAALIAWALSRPEVD